MIRLIRDKRLSSQIKDDINASNNGFQNISIKYISEVHVYLYKSIYLIINYKLGSYISYIAIDIDGG